MLFTHRPPPGDAGRRQYNQPVCGNRATLWTSTPSPPLRRRLVSRSSTVDTRPSPAAEWSCDRVAYHRRRRPEDTRTSKEPQQCTLAKEMRRMAVTRFVTDRPAGTRFVAVRT